MTPNLANIFQRLSGILKDMGIVKNLQSWVKAKRQQLTIGYHLLEFLHSSAKDLARLTPLATIDFARLSPQDWCEHKELEVFKKRTTITNLNPYRILRCKKCGVGFREHIPSIQSITDSYNKPDYYYQGIFRSFDSKGCPLIEQRNRTFRDYLTQVGFHNHRFTGKRYLELGCGVGFSLLEMKNQGWEPHGMDISSWAINYVNKQLNIATAYQTDDISKLKLANEFFDFIHLGHVIEHLTDPFSTLKEIARILKKNGLLFIITPDMERDLYNNYIKDHFWFFNAYALKYWLSVVGLKECKILNDGVDIHVTNQPYIIAVAEKK